MKTALLLLSLAAAGCYENIRHFRYDEHLTIETVDLRLWGEVEDDILAGFSWWSCLGTHVDTQPGGFPMVVRARTFPDIVAHYSAADGSITFDPDKMRGLSRIERRAIAAHEMGHAFGLAHVDDPTELMKHLTPPVDHVTPGAVRAFDDAQGFDMDQHDPSVCRP